MKQQESIKFHVIWPLIKGMCHAKACHALSSADADDLVSEYSFSVWSMLQTPKFRKNKNNAEHVKSYLLRVFKFRIIDYIRKRKRVNLMLEDYAPYHPQFYDDNVVDNITKKELVMYAEKISPNHSKVMQLILDGWSYREIGMQLGLGASTIVRYVKEGMARLSLDERVDREQVEVEQETTNRKDGAVMATQLTFKQAGNVLKVISNKIVVALATLADDSKSVVGIEVRKDSPVAQNVIQSAVYQHLGIVSEKKATPAVAKAPAGAVAKVKKEAPKANPALMPKQGLNLDNIKDVPATIKDWAKKCGGEGYCLGGSGMPVGRRFKPGYDAKLKSVLKRLGTPNAKALAKELGWSAMIKWN